MGRDAWDTDPSIAPEEALSILGNGTRLDILMALANADGPVSFSALRDQVGITDSGQFNYHLDQLRDHFVRRTDEGYRLRRAGARVIEAILSGATTDLPAQDPTPVARPCPYCGGVVELRIDPDAQRPLRPFCRECPGAGDSATVFASGQIAELELPPAGFHGRDADGLLQAAITWEHLECLAAYVGVCPRCSAAIDTEISLCDEHDTTEGRCPSCRRRIRAALFVQCPNCPFELQVPLSDLLVASTPGLAFLADHGLNPLRDPWGPVTGDATEDIRSRDPFEAVYELAVGGETIRLSIDGTLTVSRVS